MKRITIIFLIRILCMNPTHAQNYFPILPGFNNPVRTLFYDSTANILYAGGSFWQLANGMPMPYVSLWNGTNWDSLGSSISGTVLSIVKYNGFIYAGGSIVIKDSLGNWVGANICYWDGANWMLPPGGGANPAGVVILYADGNDLYVGGTFNTIGGMAANQFARFDGSSWHTYPSIDPTGTYVNAIAIYNSELYIAGNFNAGFGKADIVKYDGTNWVSVGGGFTGGNTWVRDLRIYQGSLYVGGYFQTAGGDPGNNIAIWNGTSWSQPANGVMPASVEEMHEFNDELYVGGQINNASGIPVLNIAKWNGINWSSVPGLDTLVNAGVTCFASNGNDLYIWGGDWIINNDTFYTVIQYSLPLGIEEANTATGNLNTFPNPAHDIITITCPPNFTAAQLILYDAMGRVKVQSSKFKVQGSKNQITLNISHLPQGIYFYEVRDREGRGVYGKVVKE